MNSLLSTIINKLNGNDRKIAPLFVAPSSSTNEENIDDGVELACGHIVCKKNDGGASSARFSIDGILANFPSLKQCTARCAKAECLLIKAWRGSESEW